MRACGMEPSGVSDAILSNLVKASGGGAVCFSLCFLRAEWPEEVRT